MKITMYELLGMVKDGKAPKKIKYDGQEYKITKILLEDNNYYFNYINEDMECIFPINTNHLNDEVEILEEEKKIPEKLELPSFIEFKTMSPEARYVVTAKEYYVLNKIIDYLKSKGDE